MLKFKKGEAKEQYNNSPAPKITRNDTFVAEVVKIEPFKSEAHPDWAPSIKFIFRLIEDEFYGGFASGLTAADWNKGNKLDTWLIALGVETANIGDELSSEQLRGQIAKVKIELSPGKDGQPGFANVKGLEKMHPVDFQRISTKYKKHVTGAKSAPPPPAQAPAPAPVAQPVAPAPVAPAPVAPVVQPIAPIQAPIQVVTPKPVQPFTPPQITGDDVPF